MRISYVHGPGDAFGTYQHWREGRADTNLIKQTYSGQFYDLIAETDGAGQILCLTPTGASVDPRFTFVTLHRGTGRRLRYYFEQVRYALSVGAALRGFAPDAVVISNDFPCYLLNLLPAGPSKILTMHNTFWKPYGAPEGRKERVIIAATRRALRLVDMAVCVSKECERQFRAMRDGTEVFTKVQTPRLAERLDQGSASADGRRIVYVGRVEQSKGVVELIEAFARVLQQVPDARLRIVGDGGALDECKRLAERLSLSDTVEFTGRLGAEAVGRAYARSDICVYPTRSAFNEGLGTVPIEAASYGVPSVMSLAVPAREQFSAATPTFEPMDTGALADRLTTLLTDRNAYERARLDARDAYVATMRDTTDWKTGILECLSRIGAQRAAQPSHGR